MSHSYFCLIDLDRPTPKEVVYHPSDCMAAKWSLKKREEASLALEKSLRKGSAGNEVETAQSPKAKKKGKRAKRREAEEEERNAVQTKNGEGDDADDNGSDTAVTTANNFKICMQYSNLLFFDFIGKQELVVVEQPWLDVVGRLGEVKDRKVYGA